MKHLLRPKRDAHGSAACRPDGDYRGVRAVVHRAGMASCARAAGWGDLGTGQTHGDGGVAGDGVGARALLSQVPSGIEPRTLVGAGGGSTVAGGTAGGVGANRTGGDGAGRHDRAAVGRADCSPRNLSRSGAFEPGAFCENPWSAVVEFDAVGAGALGTAGVGATVSDGVVSVRALLSRAGSDPPVADRAGTTNPTGGGSVVTPPREGGRGRQPLRGPGVAGRPAQQTARGHPVASRCRALRAGPRAPGRSTGSSPQEGPTAADAGASARRSGHLLDIPDPAPLVQPGRADRGDRQWYGGVVSRRQTTGAPPLGTGARSPQRFRAASLSLHRPMGNGAGHTRLVRSTLASGGHLRRGPRAPRGRDPAPVV